MLAKIEEFHENMIQDILASATSRSMSCSEVFYELICEELVETGELAPNLTSAYYKHLVGRYPMEVSGFSYDEDRQVLSIVISELFQEDNIETLTSKLIEQKIKRAYNFVVKSIEGLYRELEETSDSFSMSYFIYDKYQHVKINRIKIILISDGKKSRSYKEIILKSIDSMQIETLIVDLEYLFNNYSAQNADTSFEVDVNLPCLEAPTNTEKYRSYMTFITGNQLYEIYDRFGKKLLEQNVRTFLQFRGGINKGIRNTIDGAPEMFFAYNNGITATASALDFNSQGDIIKIHNLQIVNGGQTTSSIYAAKKTHKTDISNVCVQMKISVVDNTENHGDFVAKVAEYANTQNKVNKSDFFSNSPFHKEFKVYSSKTWIPSSSQVRERWFYERVRGEYLNEQSYLSLSEKKKFEKSFPRDKKIDKTSLAKSEISWLQKPSVVSKGGQESFVSFAEHISYELEKNNLTITEEYYKDAISRVILFRSIEQIVSNSHWYHGGFRANVVAYTISYFSYYLGKNKSYFDFTRIWEIQIVPDELIKVIANLAEHIFKVITNPPKGSGNPGQWTKKVSCWEFIKGLDYKLDIPSNYLLDKEQQNFILKEAKKTKKMDKGIEAQSFVIEVSNKDWSKLLEYYSQNSNRTSLNLTEFDILLKLATGKLGLPSEKQAVILYKIYEKALNEGFIMENIG
ncbi:AIPR family protein [Paenibacillus endoradicis]|uniref:AIPR family protein n=1 Tax=Paenibacillus endoradicis TaxID=2972487 RepID=UPI002158E63D|nr:AIPR family protein [Paenibacillus endoradicis]MCR8657811.1 AIPR family protein [Paenibacillus endoradicis]